MRMMHFTLVNYIYLSQLCIVSVTTYWVKVYCALPTSVNNDNIY